MPGLLDHAIAFAQTILRADTTAYLGESIGRLTDLIGFLKSPLGGQAQPVGNVVVQRAMGLAIGHATLTAPAGLLHGLGICELCVNLIKIFPAHTRVTLWRHVAVDSHEFQHWLLGHGANSMNWLLNPVYGKLMRIKSQ